MKVHIEGMGISGGLLAVFLELHDIEFTWHDTNAQKTAWKASTGGIYPGGSTKFGPDGPCYEVWQQWFLGALLKEHPLADHLEECNFVFGHKSCAPHKGKYPIIGPTDHGLRMAEPPSYHFNAQTFVPWVREHFTDRQVHASSGQHMMHDETTDFYIVSHGFGARFDGAYWGWNRLVELEYDSAVYGAQGRRPCFYFRPSKILMAYAYPVANTKWWYAGSSLLYQKKEKLKSYTTEPKYEKWKENFTRLAGGAITIVDEGPITEGWRPKAADEYWVDRRSKIIRMRPLWNSGIRHFPKQLKGVLTHLGITRKDLKNVPE